MRKLLLLLLLLTIPTLTRAQTTSVSATVTDADSVAWANGTYTFTSAAYPTVAIITGTLDASGSFTNVTFPINNATAGVGGRWTARICPVVTAPCFSTVVLIPGGATLSLSGNLSPPAIRLAANSQTPLTAYNDVEITGAVQGNTYFNVTDLTQHTCKASPCASNWVSAPNSSSGTFTSLSVTASDPVTAAAMFEPFKANVNAANSQSIFQSFYSPTSYDSAPVTGAMICPSGATKIQCTSVIGLMDVTSGVNGTAGVALGGYARSTSTNAHTFGLNSNASDCTTASCGSNITSTNLIGYEADCNANLSGSACTNILVRGVYNTGASATGIVYAQPLGTKGVYDFGLNFQTNATAAPGANNAAIFFNPVASGATQVSQGIEFQSTNGASSSLFSGLNLSAAGNLTVSTSGANTGFLAPMLTAGNALCTGSITGDGCFNRAANSGVTYLGSNGNGFWFRNAATMQLGGSDVTSITPGSSGTIDIGASGSLFNNLFLNGAAGGNASAGSVGEYVSSTLATGSSITLSTGTTANITSISLTAGDWDVTGAVDFTFGATTSYTNLIGSISTTSATIGAQDSKFDFETPAAVPTASADATYVLPTVRVSVASTTTVFLVAQGTFTVSSLKAYGTIRARRIR